MAANAEIRTERLLLRPQRLDDVDAVTELASRREVAATTLNVPHPFTAIDARAWIEESVAGRARGRRYGYAITQHETGRLLGAIGLHMDADRRGAELGYWIGVPYWGRGYATEATCALVEFGFGNLKLERIYAQHFVENPGSGRVLAKAGLRYEGLLRRHVPKWGERKDVAIYGLLRGDIEQNGCG